MDSPIVGVIPDSKKPATPTQKRPRRRLLSDYLPNSTVPPPAVSPFKSEFVKLAEKTALAQPDEVVEKLTQLLNDSSTARFVLGVQDVSEKDANKRDFLTVTDTDAGHYIGASPREESDAPPTAQLESAPATSEQDDEIIVMMRKADSADNEEMVINRLYTAYHPLIVSTEKRDHARANRILRQVKVDDYPVSVLVGFLMMTFAHSAKFDERGNLFKRVKDRVASSAQADELMPYLVDLE